MKFQDEFRDRQLVSIMADNIRRMAERLTAPVNFMEVCGTHTMSIYQHGIRSLLPESVRLVSGPGCPVCVTPVGYVDTALATQQTVSILLSPLVICCGFRAAVLHLWNNVPSALTSGLCILHWMQSPWPRTIPSAG